MDVSEGPHIKPKNNPITGTERRPIDTADPEQAQKTAQATPPQSATPSQEELDGFYIGKTFIPWPTLANLKRRSAANTLATAAPSPHSSTPVEGSRSITSELTTDRAVNPTDLPTPETEGVSKKRASNSVLSYLFSFMTGRHSTAVANPPTTTQSAATTPPHAATSRETPRIQTHRSSGTEKSKIATQDAQNGTAYTLAEFDPTHPYTAKGIGAALRSIRMSRKGHIRKNIAKRSNNSSATSPRRK
ncbi:hypothetical protein BU26DRAFT_522880 [Trematosphaeria pertusa]|uniref:Uncharacterized protein n=1 Tax=Trematosphaeria pertusa TaxID=390896 RepID=A0A6A6I162_9PLEO|nr:uncharacterized protein BU26DRAFT_522880 [Trematosphaeria pertusa]KAF2244185.1 hypothetical protein BU26DRAFT_522880 [Trematosphaeria pertusa]